MTWTVVLSNIFDGWSFPFLAEYRLIDSGFDFVIILKILSVLTDTEKDIIFTY